MRDEAPSIEEISAYCSENNLNVNVEKFYNYYARSNFLYRGAPMDWKSQLEKWDKTEYKSQKKQQVWNNENDPLQTKRYGSKEYWDECMAELDYWYEKTKEDT